MPDLRNMASVHAKPFCVGDLRAPNSVSAVVNHPAKLTRKVNVLINELTPLRGEKRHVTSVIDNRRKKTGADHRVVNVGAGFTETATVSKHVVDALVCFAGYHKLDAEVVE